MKLSISLSDALESPLKAAIKSLGSPTVSLLIEVAVAGFLELDPKSQAAALRRRVADRAAVTRSGWSRSFWQLLGARMGLNDLQENELASRQYETHIVVMLLPEHDRYATEDEGFTIHAAPKDNTNSGRSTWTFERGIAPSFAADSVAKWLNTQQGVAET